MKLLLERLWKKNTYTIGLLWVDGKIFCDTLEDRDRGLLKSMSDETIARVKVPGETAIPRGEYAVSLDVISPKYSQIDWYKNICGGRMPRLLSVPGFEGILIHPGNGPEDTNGCILVGDNLKKGRVLNSRNRFSQLYAKMKAAHDKGETITIEIR